MKCCTCSKEEELPEGTMICNDCLNYSMVIKRRKAREEAKKTRKKDFIINMIMVCALSIVLVGCAILQMGGQ